MRQGLAAIATAWHALLRQSDMVLLAEVAGHAGQVEVGLRCMAEALTALEASGWRRHAGRWLSTVRSKYTASSTHSVYAWQVAETPRQTGGAIAVRSTKQTEAGQVVGHSDSPAA
jgi:hypothetical protein